MSEEITEEEQILAETMALGISKAVNVAKMLGMPEKDFMEMMAEAWGKIKEKTSKQCSDHMIKIFKLELLMITKINDRKKE